MWHLTNEITGKGLVRHVLIRYGFTTKELMVCVIINGNSIPKVEKLIDRLTAIEGMKSISINQNTKKTNVILGDVTKCIVGRSIHYRYDPSTRYEGFFTD